MRTADTDSRRSRSGRQHRLFTSHSRACHQRGRHRRHRRHRGEGGCMGRCSRLGSSFALARHVGASVLRSCMSCAFRCDWGSRLGRFALQYIRIRSKQMRERQQSGLTLTVEQLPQPGDLFLLRLNPLFETLNLPFVHIEYAHQPRVGIERIGSSAGGRYAGRSLLPSGPLDQVGRSPRVI